MFFSLLFPVV